MELAHLQLAQKKPNKKKRMNKQLSFLKPGQYMSASDNRFVVLKSEEPCLVLEKRERFDWNKPEARYVVLVNNQQLIASDGSFVSKKRN